MVLFIQLFVRFENFPNNKLGNTVPCTVPLTDQQPSPECLPCVHIFLRLVLLVFLLFKKSLQKILLDSVDIAQFCFFLFCFFHSILFYLGWSLGCVHTKYSRNTVTLLKSKFYLSKRHLLGESQMAIVEIWSPSFVSWVIGIWGAQCSCSLWEWPQDGSVSERCFAWKLDVRVWLKGVDGSLAALILCSSSKRFETKTWKLY